MTYHNNGTYEWIFDKGSFTLHERAGEAMENISNRQCKRLHNSHFHKCMTGSCSKNGWYFKRPCAREDQAQDLLCVLMLPVAKMFVVDTSLKTIQWNNCAKFFNGVNIAGITWPDSSATWTTSVVHVCSMVNLIFVFFFQQEPGDL